VPIGVFGVLMALRVMPESYDPSAGRRIDWIGMALIGAGVFSLTYALVEANSRGWGDPVIVGLLVAAVVLTAAFAASQRFGRHPMLTRDLVRNRQFIGACAAFLLFAIGVMGLLFLCVIAFVNLWGYSELEAALAISPVPLLGLIVSPLVGRMADRVPPRMVALPALVSMSVGLLWFSSFPAHPDYLYVLPALCLVGAGMGAVFPAVNVGAMGSISGDELGLGSGIVNMSRQVGFTLGVAILVAVFTGVVDNRAADVRAQAAQIASKSGLSPAQRRRLVSKAFVNPTEQGGGRRFEPRTPVERRVADVAAEAARDAFAAGFRVAALAVLLATPFTLTMRRRPSEARRAAAPAAAAG
jgi:MFS family permease